MTGFQGPSGWTVERTDTLKAEWLAGTSASKIAAKLGGISRSGVIGKAHRLKLNARPIGGPSGPRPKKERTRSVAQRRPLQPRFAPFYRILEAAGEPDAIPEPPIDDLAIPAHQRRSLLELNATTCRWPIGTPGTKEFFFCGGPAVQGCPYCTGHCRIAYQAGTARKPYVAEGLA